MYFHHTYFHNKHKCTILLNNGVPHGPINKFFVFIIFQSGKDAQRQQHFFFVASSTTFLTEFSFPSTNSKLLFIYFFPLSQSLLKESREFGEVKYRYITFLVLNTFSYVHKEKAGISAAFCRKTYYAFISHLSRLEK